LIASKLDNAILIDPVKEEIKKYQKKLKEFNLKLKYAIDTHVHADHITALGNLRDIYNCETIMGEQSKVNCVSQFMSDNEILYLDEIKIKAIYTPGHTDDSYCYLLNANEKQFLFSGDTLLIKGNGRTDFQNGDPSNLFESLHKKILILDDETIVYPAHDYKGVKTSTIKEEKLNNHRLNMDKDTFINFMNNLELETPKLIDLAVPLNKECGIIK
jgi:glyoxylase-like metal-dependent hydrolase (beta-lactamase superfamily II)